MSALISDVETQLDRLLITDEQSSSKFIQQPLATYRKFEWFASRHFLISKDMVKKWRRAKVPFVVNMVFLKEHHELPPIGFTPFSLAKMHMDGLPMEPVTGLINHRFPHVLVHKYDYSSVPDWTKQKWKSGDVVKYIIEFPEKAIGKFSLQYQFKDKRSPTIFYDLPPLRSDVHIMVFLEDALLNQEEPILRMMTDPEYLEFIEQPQLTEDSLGIIEPSTSRKSQSTETYYECKICYNTQSDRMFMPCKHCFCQECIAKMEEKKTTIACPFCHIKRESVVKLRRTNQCLICGRNSDCLLDAVSIPCGCVFACYEKAEEDKVLRCRNCQELLENVVKAFFD